MHPRITAAAAGLAALAVLSLALLAGGAVTPEIIPGLPEAGPLTLWGLPISKAAMNIASALTVGSLTFAAALAPSDKGLLSEDARTALRATSWCAVAWGLAAAATLLFTVSDATAIPVWAVDQLVTLASETQQGVALTLVVLFALAIALFASGAISVNAAGGLLALALLNLLPVPLTGHSSSSPNHSLATTGVALHVIGVALWVGGLAFVILYGWRARSQDAPAFSLIATRYSAMALWCFITVGVSGVASAAARVLRWDWLVATPYGLMILMKAGALVILGYFGWWHRGRTLPLLGKGRPRAFLRFASVEVGVMAATVGLAVALARTAPPEDLSYEPSTAEVLLGYPLPPPISAWNLLAQSRLEFFFALFVLVSGGLYAAGVVRLMRRGDRWPVGRTISWFAGLAIILLVTQTGLQTYSMVLFSVHMIEHMTLSMLVPIFLVLGAPVTLALRALRPARRRGDRGPREWITAIMNSRAVNVITHPVVATIIFMGSTYALYFTPLFETLMRDHSGHLAMSIHFLASGFLFFWVVIGVDPGPRRLPFVGKLLTLFVTMPFHAFFGIALMMMTSVLGSSWFDALGRTWGEPALADQGTGGAIAWGFGEIPTIIVIVVLVFQWARDDSRRARVADRRGDRELDDYNAYLASLDRSSRQDGH